jgi:hypothetical protein
MTGRERGYKIIDRNAHWRGEGEGKKELRVREMKRVRSYTGP